MTRGLRMHWRPVGAAAACGMFVDARSIVVANHEAVNCGNCLRSHSYISAVREAQREARAAGRDLPF